MRLSNKSLSLILAGIVFGLILLPAIFATLEIPKSDIIFSHKKHADQPCINCHDNIEQSDKSEDKNLPTMDICTQCHDGTTLPNECSVCHRDKENPQALVNPKRDFIFSHKKHLERKTDCVNCHGEVAQEEKLTSKNMPDMAKCFECHEGTRVPNQCDLCHAAMKLRRYHPNDWLHSHQYQLTTKTEKCVQCHQNTNMCQTCHQGDN
ncbi:MAG TPA: cytochrome c3 family protein, partial [Terriglobales bacterium]|nr:cytochrome c3 family protein [Terriglobales bacterium]